MWPNSWHRLLSGVGGEGVSYWWSGWWKNGHLPTSVDKILFWTWPFVARFYSNWRGAFFIYLQCYHFTLPLTIVLEPVLFNALKYLHSIDKCRLAVLEQTGRMNGLFTKHTANPMSLTQLPFWNLKCVKSTLLDFCMCKCLNPRRQLVHGSMLFWAEGTDCGKATDCKFTWCLHPDLSFYNEAEYTHVEYTVHQRE